MKKKTHSLVAILLAGMMAGSVAGLAACNNSSDESGNVVIAYVAGTNLLPDEEKVQAAVDAYCQETYGIGITFKHVNIYDQASVYTNWLGANEEIDILNLCFVDPMQYINEKRILCLDDLVTEENAPYLYETLETRPDMKLLDTEGNLYGIGTQEIAPVYGGGMIIFKRSTLQTIGLYGEGEGQYEEWDLIDYDDLDTIFEAVASNPATNKTENGSTVYPCPIISATAPYSTFAPADFMSSGTQSPLAVLKVEEDGSTKPEVVNYYEMDTFKEYLEKVSEWNAKGYIHPDALTTTSTYGDMLDSGQWVSMFLSLQPGLIPTYNMEDVEEGDSWMALVLTEVPYYTSSTPLMSMAINSKSKRPNKAMRIIDAIFSDEKLVNMLQYGLEGVHWEYAETEEDPDIGRENGYITLTEENLEQSLYTGLPGVYGNKNIVYSAIAKSDDMAEKIKEAVAYEQLTLEYSEEALQHSSVAAGFIYDNSKQKVRIQNIEGNVISRYLSQLVTGKGKAGTDGTYTGPGSTYADFIEALENAKVDTVIADKQEQLDAWLALQN